MSGTPAVLFDLDDTLYTERDFLHSGWHAVAREAGKRGFPDAAKAYELMEKAPDAFDALNEAYPEFPVADMLDVYRNHMPDIHLKPGARHAVMQLRDAGAPVGIITDGRSISQRNKIQALGLDTIVDYIGISAETGADKHQAQPFLHAEEHFGKHRPYIYVGDNPAKDFAQANKLGWHTVMLREPAPGANVHPQNLAEVGIDKCPDFIISDIQDILRIYSKIAESSTDNQLRGFTDA